MALDIWHHCLHLLRTWISGTHCHTRLLLNKLSQLNRHCHLSGIPVVLSVQSASDTATFLNLSYLWIWVAIHGRDIPAVVGGHLAGAHCLLHQWVLEIELRSSGLVRSILTQDISYLMPHPASFRLFWCAFQFNMPNFVHFWTHCKISVEGSHVLCTPTRWG